MTTKNRMTRTFSYKRAEGDKNTTLEELLRLAIKSQSLIRQRKLDVSYAKDEETFHILSDYSDPKIYLAGILCSYSPGRHQQVFALEDDAITIPLTSIAPPLIKKAGKELRQEFLDGCLYFLVRGNHVVLSQSMGFRADKAETYFTWLLREKAKLLEPPSVIYLNDELPPAKSAKIQHVRSFTISNSIELTSVVSRDMEETKTFSIRPQGPFWDALKALIPTLPNQYSLTHALATEVIQASLTLKLGRKGKDAEDFVDSVATTLRNHDLDYTIDMGKFGKLRSNEFKLGSLHVFSTDNGEINQLEIFSKMNDWLDELIAVKRIHRTV